VTGIGVVSEDDGGEDFDRELARMGPEERHWVTSEVLPSILRFGFYIPGINPGMDLPTALKRYAAFLREEDAAPERAIEAAGAGEEAV
jgi:hypothetical protein